VQQDPAFVQDGRITLKGIEALKQRLPHADFAVIEKDPQISKVAEIFTVESLVRFVERKLAAK
jgi:acyl carrier protein